MPSAFEPFSHASYRPSVHPRMRLPVAARSVGHYRKEPGWREVPVHKAFVELFWSVAGEGWIVYDGKKHRFPPEHIALYFPGDPHLLGQDGAEL